MFKKRFIVFLPVILALTLTGCGDKIVEAPPSPLPAVETSAPALAAPIETALPAVAVEVPATGLENTDAAELEKTIQSYNEKVDASNDKAEGVIEAYNDRIESVTGNQTG